MLTAGAAGITACACCHVDYQTRYKVIWLMWLSLGLLGCEPTDYVKERALHTCVSVWQLGF